MVQLEEAEETKLMTLKATELHSYMQRLGYSEALLEQIEPRLKKHPHVNFIRLRSGSPSGIDMISANNLRNAKAMQESHDKAKYGKNMTFGCDYYILDRDDVQS